MAHALEPARYAATLAVGGVRATAFWLSVLLSLSYVPVLSGLVVEPSAEVVTRLLALHVASLVAGRKHNAEDR